MSLLSPLYLLERFDVGIVHLDAERRVTSMNDLARRTLPVAELQPFGRRILEFHPPRSQPKVEFMLSQAAACPVAHPPLMTMIINIPERVLLIKVTRVSGMREEPAGYTLVFYDMTDIVSTEAPPADEPNPRRRLTKIPTISGHELLLVDAGDIVHLHSDGHYTRVVTATANRFCNLSIGDIELRLDPELFMRVHRSHIVQLSAIQSLVREGGRLLLQLTSGGEPVPVSRTSANDLMARLGMPATTSATPRKSH
ncbi:MAG TPA: LytTR family transcriptional regulator DNA-binding domain-containing protein [Burkholderiaceae bacterium]|nr:LytTR family transcriptional regulator DNA-binding domain-containing protein [Burkholderiaceae bacterium]